MPPVPPPEVDQPAFWRRRQTALDTWQRSRLAGFLYLFGWGVVAWLGDVVRHAPVAVALAAAAFVAFALLRLRMPPPPVDDVAAHGRWFVRYAVALTLAPALWAALQVWLLLDARLSPDVVMASLIATIGYATVIVNVYSPMPRAAAAGAAVLFVPMLAVLWSQPDRHGIALAATLYACYLVGALLRTHADYRRRLDLDAALREQRDLYARLSRIDPLTGVANRRLFTERLDGLAQRGEPFRLLILDIDHFKRINDRHGHAVGDACLRQFAARLGAAFPPPATIARLGGEEFGVLVDGDGAAGAAAAEAFRAALAALPIDADGAAVAITVSIGMGLFEPGQHADGEALYRVVDEALYAAKSAGRNRVQAVGGAAA